MDLNKYIEDQLENIDLSVLVKHEIREQVRGEIAREIKTLVREGIERIIADEIDLIMKEDIEVNDGYGTAKQYKSFADFFKIEFKKRLNKTYEMKKLINKAVTEKVAALFDDQINDAIKEIIAKLTKELGK
jgi:type III secretory pathway lipoprotein EscJ